MHLIAIFFTRTLGNVSNYCLTLSLGRFAKAL